MNLYILRLKEGKYYIGTTSKDIGDRLQEHMSGRGSSWTRKYKVLKLEKTIENCDKYDEDKWTKIYMDRHGIENVRGGSYCQLKLDHNSIETLSREISHANNKCLYCNKLGHFVSTCPNKMNTTSKMYSKNLNYLNMSCDYESESDDEYTIETIEELEEAFNDANKEDGIYTYDGEKYIWYEGEFWEESPHTFCGSRDGTIYTSQFNEHIRPMKKMKKKKKNNSGKCYKCGRFGHYASKCYARKHVKGYSL